MFDRVLVANRGEIAVRIARTLRDLGVAVVAVHSDPDRGARHVALADDAVRLPGSAPADTYLNVEAIVAAARSSGAQAVHPGYGFLSENAAFAEAVIEAGVAWVGPPPEALRIAGDKIRARAVALSAGVPIVPGLLDCVDDARAVRAFAADHGYPVAIKAAGGGGGRGLKVARSAADVDDALAAAAREARAYFGTADVYVERYLDAPKHLEVQVLAAHPGEAVWLGARDCSLQRRHQKLIEEAPPPRHTDVVADMGDAAVALAKACGYVNAGTVEFLVDADGAFYFLEINARLQVEHTVTEEVYGVDLVACQLRIAADEPLGFAQTDLVARGHAIECRINVEDPARGFAPAPGVVACFVAPDGPGVRVDAGYVSGDAIPAAYDSLAAKVVVWAEDRRRAIARMRRALEELVVEGVPTTVPAHLVLLAHPDFVAGTHTTATVESSGVLDALAAGGGAGASDVLMVEGRPVRLWNPAMAASAAGATHGASAVGDVVAPMQGTIVDVLVDEGATVAAGDAVVVLEAMKMETTLAATRSGRVAAVHVAAGDAATAGQVLVELA